MKSLSNIDKGEAMTGLLHRQRSPQVVSCLVRSSKNLPKYVSNARGEMAAMKCHARI